jgi:hypothetical protein
MIGFLKKLFGGDATTNKEAGVQIEQAPYKVPEPAATTPVPLVTEPVVAAKTAPKQPTAVKSAPKKQGTKPATGSKPRSRKPKTAKQPK